jgi:hypothetical protein
MGILRGRDKISRALQHFSALPSDETYKAFEKSLFKLIGEAFIAIKTDNVECDLDETLISTSLFHALELMASKDHLPLTVTPERHEITEEISLGKKTGLHAKRYDIFLNNWDYQNTIKYGVEAKLLTEANVGKRNSNYLLKEYLSEAGMGKFIGGVYRERGCMIGYVLQGKVHMIVKKLNHLIETTHNALQILNKYDEPGFEHIEIYQSAHEPHLKYLLYHLMLKLNDS